jgi:exodeoxyribonuclease VII small subunit
LAAAIRRAAAASACSPINRSIGSVAKTQSKEKSSGEPPSFEQALGQLEAIVTQLEEGQLGLDDSLGEYQKGVKYLRVCYELLEKAQRRVELLTGVDADGNPTKVDFDDQSSESLAAKAASRSKRRSRSKSNTATEGSDTGATTDMDSGATLF